MSTKSVVPFSFEGNEVRVVEGPDGKPWYCAVDACGILGYKKTSDAVQVHCKAKGTAKYGTLTSGGLQEVLFVSEPNLYRLVCRSRLPAAERFEEWVFEVLIPSAMRSLGVHPHQPNLESLFRDKYIGLLEKGNVSLEADKAKLEAELAKLQKKIRSLNAARPCTPEQVMAFVYLRERGLSIGAISRITERSRGTIRRHLAEVDEQHVADQIRELTAPPWENGN